jgi:hypothetical protein
MRSGHGLAATAWRPAAPTRRAVARSQLLLTQLLRTPHILRVGHRLTERLKRDGQAPAAAVTALTFAAAVTQSAWQGEVTEERGPAKSGMGRGSPTGA